MITTKRDGSRFLIVPEQAETPEGVEEDIVILKQPIQDIYLVASAVMDMFCQLDGLDAISFSGQKQENWYIKDAKKCNGRREASLCREVQQAGLRTACVKRLQTCH